MAFICVVCFVLHSHVTESQQTGGCTSADPFLLEQFVKWMRSGVDRKGIATFLNDNIRLCSYLYRVLPSYIFVVCLSLPEVQGTIFSPSLFFPFFPSELPKCFGILKRF